MHNSESKLTSHFGPIKTRNSENCGAQFSVVFFLQDGNQDYSALESLRQQSLFHWELIVVRSPTWRLDYSPDVSTYLGGRNFFCVDYEMAWKILNSRPTKYLAFLQQETIWHPERLAHDYHLLESTSVPVVVSVPLVWATDTQNAFAPRTSTIKNVIIAGTDLLRQMAEQKLAYFDLDVVSVCRSKLLACLPERYTYVSVALLRSLQTNDVYCSDKCLSERRSKPVFKLQDLTAAAKELLGRASSS